ncbi:MAG: PEGA domain-containing protein [Polyangiaceae bacterium]
MRTIRTLLLAFALAMGGASASHAAGPQASAAPTPDAVARARKLFDEGLVHVKKKEWKEAEPLFAEALSLNPTYDVAANLGHVRDKLGKAREAAELLDLAVRSWPLSAKTRAQRELSVKRLEELRATLGTLSIEVNVPGAAVIVNGRDVGHAPIGHDVFVDPGAIAIEANFAGYAPAKQALTATKGTRSELTLTLTALAGASSTSVVSSATPTSSAAPTESVSASGSGTVAPVPSSAPTATPGPQKEILLTGGALTLAAIATGVGLLVASADKSAEAAKLRGSLDATYGVKPCTKAAAAKDCQAVVDVLSSRVALGDAGGSVLIGAGIVAGATLGYWLFMRPRRVEVTPAVAPGTAGLVVQGAW